MSTDSYSGIEGSEVEDLFPAAFVADAVERLYRGRTEDFGDVLRQGETIVPLIEAWAKSQDITLEPGCKVELSRLVKSRSLTARPAAFDAACLERWTRLFDHLLG